MKLRDLVERVEPVATAGPMDREITSIAYDSRQVTPGTMFVAIPGHNVDGHDFILSAVGRGATAVLCEKTNLVPPSASCIRVADTREALSHMAATFYGHPSRKLKMIGVTGTNGKTTTAFMIKHLLETAGIKTGLISTVRYEIGERMIPAHRTTPEALEVQRMLSQMVRDDCAACVMEVSSHALSQSRVADVEFDVAVFTNLTQDHLDYHGSMEEYFISKKKLFHSFCERANPGISVINVDDAFGRRLAEEIAPEKRFTVGCGETAAIRATDLEPSADETRFRLRTADSHHDCRLSLVGRHNVDNALAAAGVALALKLERSDIVAGFASMPQVPGRLEQLDLGQPFKVMIDYAHTEDALVRVLQTVRGLTEGRLLLTFGCGGNRDTGKRRPMGKAAAEFADHTIITTDNPRRESAAAIAGEIALGFGEATNFEIELDRALAIDRLIRMAGKGDVVLIAGKGHESYQEFADTVVPFDDRNHARDTLEALGFGYE